MQDYISHLSYSSPWWLQSWPCWVGGSVPLQKAGGWLAVNGSYSSGCSSGPRLSFPRLSSSLGPATSSSPPAGPSLHCQNTENYNTDTSTIVRDKEVDVFPWWMYPIIPSSRKGGGHRGWLRRGASDLFPIRTSRWRCWRREDAHVSSHGIIRIHWKFRESLTWVPPTHI